eukprot:scaffold47949_cov21-Tisochrysis_lutea.AAC.6
MLQHLEPLFEHLQLLSYFTVRHVSTQLKSSFAHTIFTPAQHLQAAGCCARRRPRREGHQLDQGHACAC